MSSLCIGHVNLLCIIPVLLYALLKQALIYFENSSLNLNTLNNLYFWWDALVTEMSEQRMGVVSSFLKEKILIKSLLLVAFEIPSV